MSDLHPISIPTPFPVGPVNVYLLDGPSPALVDAGPDTDAAMEALQKGLAAYGHTLSEIRHLVITHAHPDHYGLAARLVAESRAQLYAHRFNVPLLAGDPSTEARSRAFWEHMLQRAGVPRLILAVIQQGFSAVSYSIQPVEVDVPLEDDDVLTLGGRSWEIIHTPGHSRGHICLFHRTGGQLLSGDHLLRDISSNPILEPPLPGETERPHSLSQYLQSLKRIADLEVTTAWPGHGAPISSPRELIAMRMAFHVWRSNEIAEILARGPRTAYEIAIALFPDLQGINVSLGISEVIGHLDLLDEAGRVVVLQEETRERYALANYAGE